MVLVNQFMMYVLYYGWSITTRFIIDVRIESSMRTWITREMGDWITKPTTRTRR